MLSVKDIRENLQSFCEALTRRGYTEAEAQLLKIEHLEQEIKVAQQHVEKLQANSNRHAQEIAQAQRLGMTHAKIESLIQSFRTQKAEEKNILNTHRKTVEALSAQQRSCLLELPNLPHKDIPSDENIVKASWGTPKEGSFRPHWEVLSALGCDLESGARVTGRGFPFYRGQMAQLVRALIAFFLEEAHTAGYEEIRPPLLVNEAAAIGTGQMPDKEGQMYRLKDDAYYLIPTAEVPLTNLCREQVLQESTLPLKYVSYTPCFRREAGSWGADVRGLNRLHQFDKVEIVQICVPILSYKVLEEMSTHVSSLLEKLKLPYRILVLSAKDLGFASAFTYDFEVFAPGQKKWLEVSSVSNFEAFQARRMHLRYKHLHTKKNLFVHTLNGSALALPRVLSAILEHYQYDTHIKVPTCLHKFTGFDTMHF